MVEYNKTFVMVLHITNNSSKIYLVRKEDPSHTVYLTVCALSSPIVRPYVLSVGQNVCEWPFQPFVNICYVLV